MFRPSWKLSGVVAALLVAAGCSGSPSGADPEPVTTFPYVVDPLEPGHGFVELAGNRYVFDGVMCAQGAARDDPEGTRRIFGVYANFEVDGTPAGVELTRYRSELHERMDTVPTVTEVAGVRMQGEGEVLGLEAKRFLVEGQRDWQDPADPQARTPLIVVDGDRYEVDATFTGVGEDATGGTPGIVAARCPAGSADTPGSADPEPAVTRPG